MAIPGDESTANAYVGELNFMERYGAAFLQRRCQRSDTDIQVWRSEDVARMQRLKRRALGFAALSGTISGATIAVIELWLRSWLVADMETAGWDELIPYWSAYLGLAGLITLIEIVYLYWLVIRNVADIVNLAGLGLASGESLMATAVSRAALDMPNPRTPFYGIDPYARISGFTLLLYTLAYRAKVGVTSIIMRLLLRRILTRAALRTIIPFVAIPLYAIWNALIVHWVMREARARAAAPIAIRQLGERLAGESDALDEEERRLLIALVAEAMLCARDAHPNFLLLLTEMSERLQTDPATIDKDESWDDHRDALAALAPHTQELALDVLYLAIVLGGPPGRRQKRLAQDAARACGRDLHRARLSTLYDRISEGRGMVALEQL